MKQRRFALSIVCPLTAAVAWIGGARTWGQAASQPTCGPATLKPDVRADSDLRSPAEPIWIQFSIRNTSDQPIELDAAMEAAGQGVLLPLNVITGSSDAPALQIAYNAEKPVPVSPPPVDSATTQPRATPIRIGSFGIIGRTVDLRELFPAVRYPGEYRVEWRPLGGKIGVASVAFRVEPRKDIVVVTDYGKMTFRLMYDQAPRNVDAFLELARDGFYNGKSIHKVIPGFIIQGGDPTGGGTGVRPDGRLLPAEFHAAPFELGTLAMARIPDAPNSASCQFFITLSRLPELDGKYTIIGQASDEESAKTLQQIAELPTDKNDKPVRPVLIRSVNLLDRDEAATARRAEGK